MAAVVSSISAQDALAAGEAIANRLAGWSNWRASSSVALFATLQGEIDTQPLFELARRDGKRLLLPRMCVGRTLEFALVEDMESLKPGRFGVLEPGPRCLAQPLHADAIVLIPGCAFDREGGRLGRGAGYYDRALATCRSRAGRPRFIGVGFDRQVVPSVPMNSLDIRMDGIVTEKGLFLSA